MVNKVVLYSLKKCVVEVKQVCSCFATWISLWTLFLFCHSYICYTNISNFKVVHNRHSN